MTRLQSGNLALFRSCICVHYQDFVAMCQVKATRPGIEGDVIEVLTPEGAERPA
jgi:hypothetical protein